ncbi:MAG: hypothetical protein PHF92_08390 [Bacteroidales bacterium]|nr:hypothetical protein [Bacteroidales bacterium]
MKTYWILCIVLISLFFDGCANKPTTPILTTNEVSDISCNSAISGGIITSDGGETIIEKGVCWSTNINPEISDNKTSDGSGNESFTSFLADLQPKTRYYVRAYASNSVGTAYGNTLSFESLELRLPELTTNEISDIKSTEALCGGVISSDGGFTITARGVCWDTIPNPTIANNKTIDGAGAGGFSSMLTDLQPKTKYYVRAYATNSNGTGYGMAMAFETFNVASLITSEVTNIFYNSAISGGTISSNGGQTITSRGVCWGTSTDSVELEKALGFTEDGSGIGSFESILVGLSPGITFYIRAYATSSIETYYGNIVTFQTLGLELPELTTNEVANIDYTSAITGGNITSDGGSRITQRGICWSTNPDPTTSDYIIVNGTGIGDFTCELTDLVPGTTYYLRAFAINEVGTAYGNSLSFETLELKIPEITTNEISEIKFTSATSGGIITSDGGSSVNTFGICWSTNSEPTISDNITVDSVEINEFISRLTNLTPGTTYYVRSYATNSIGTGYGNTIVFQTHETPILSTKEELHIKFISASCGGNISSDGGFAITARGVCWNTSPDPTINNSRTNDGTGTGVFDSELKRLTANTTYYVRAYASNEIGTIYGNTVIFKTLESISGVFRVCLFNPNQAQKFICGLTG